MYNVLVPGLLVTCVLGRIVKDVVPEMDGSVKCVGVVPA